ncbi:uncharacterized protein LOC130662328 isoform X1 [Hydractinia symbiolongicarpus]|uniref:uncharacterized protein LOC130662328 isoform X1 n=1 Tax=Hydractinia symbiolongicarpus TaxID=13093 RepID=UPI00254BB8AE|nr:uncharacterized protein LOC130662328 isoform X1 [Hydractinia symbiolongicarpus]
MLPIILLTLVSLVLGGRAPYLGGDLEPLLEETKRSGITQVPKPVTAQQKENYQRYNTKFTEIAKAYAEGYKAAIKAVQARALIAQKRLYQNHLAAQINARSTIPETPTTSSENVKENTGAFNLPVPNEVTVNGMEKSGIPHAEPTTATSDHKVVQRSVNPVGFANGPVNLISDAERKKISQLNFAARHRNFYLDRIGGSRGLVYKKHRKRRSAKVGQTPDISRQRRSRMPYLGQNLDALGVIRATPNWDEAPQKKENMPAKPSPQQIHQQSGLQVASFQQPQQQIQNGNPSSFAVRNGIAKPTALQFQQLQQRNSVPGFNPYNQMSMYPQYPYPNNAGLQQEHTSVEKIDEQPGVERSKKSASPEPDVAALNYAARHRNVYLDSVSGDPYSGGSSVLSRQNIIYKKH